MGKLSHISLIVLLVICTSCVNTIFYENYIGKVDSLNASLEASASAFEQIDALAVQTQNKKVKVNLDSLYQLPIDSILNAINEYRYIKKSYKTFLREYPLALKELQTSREQLANLKHDIEHRHLDEEMIKKYFSQEEEMITLLKKKMEIMGDMVEKQDQKFTMWNPQIELLIDSLSNIK